MTQKARPTTHVSHGPAAAPGTHTSDRGAESWQRPPLSGDAAGPGGFEGRPAVWLAEPHTCPSDPKLKRVQPGGGGDVRPTKKGLALSWAVSSRPTAPVDVRTLMGNTSRFYLWGQSRTDVTGCSASRREASPFPEGATSLAFRMFWKLSLS